MSVIERGTPAKKQLRQFVIIGLLGLVVGVTLDEGFHALRVRTKANTEAFQRRLRCKNLADNYLKESSDDNTTVLLDRDEFSPARNSCIAEVTRTEHGVRGGRLLMFDAVDILTGETLFTGLCNGNDANSATFCGNGRDMQLMERRDKVLEAALSK